MNSQLELFAAAPPAAEHDLTGLRVILPDACRWCGSHKATIAEGKGPHKAALFCCACGQHGGWLSMESFNFVSEVVRRFGRPTEPIVVRTRETAADDVPSKTATANAKEI